MNIVVPLSMLVVIVCWFLVSTGRVAPTDPRLLLAVVGAMAGGGAFFLYAYVRAGRVRAAAMRRVAEELLSRSRHAPKRAAAQSRSS